MGDRQIRGLVVTTDDDCASPDDVVDSGVIALWTNEIEAVQEQHERQRPGGGRGARPGRLEELVPTWFSHAIRWRADVLREDTVAGERCPAWAAGQL